MLEGSSQQIPNEVMEFVCSCRVLSSCKSTPIGLNMASDWDCDLADWRSADQTRHGKFLYVHSTAPQCKIVNLFVIFKSQFRNFEA